MLLVARKNLFSERTRLAISVGGVALSVFLISLLLSLYRGWSDKVGGFVEEVNIDVWIAREGTADFLSSASILPLDEADKLKFVDNVERWAPLIVRPMSATTGDTEMDVSLVGYDPALGMGGPVRIEEGKDTPGPGEVIVDRALGSRYGVEIGDSIGAAGREWKVVGISSGGDFVAAQIIFITLAEAQSALTMGGYATYLVLDLEDPAEARELAANLEEVQPGILAITREDFAQATRDRVLGDVIPILLVILIVAFVVGLAVAGLTIYTATVEKSREYGILKAVGFRNIYLYRLVFEQSLVTGILGFIAGVGAMLLVSPVARDWVPQFVLYVRWQDVLLVAGVTLLMVAIAGYIPVRRLAEIDPTSVFKA